MDLANKIVLAHRGFFNKECEKIYRENSRDVCKISSQKDYITIIELDVRKSKDGVLYCYHGTFIQYFLLLKFPRKFSALKKKYGVQTLANVLEVMNEGKILCLDLQDKTITKTEILKALAGKKFKQVILASPSVSYLENFNNMPNIFTKLINRNIFSGFYNLKKLKQKNYTYYEVLFPFQVNKKIIQDARNNGLVFSCAPLFFLSKESYWKKINRYNITYISTDFI